MRGANTLLAEFGLPGVLRRLSSRGAMPANDNPRPGAAAQSRTPDRYPAARVAGRADGPMGGAVVTFLAAGAVLFASLVIGSSGSLLLTGSDAMIVVIEQAFLSIGLRAVAAALIGVAVCLAFAAGWRRRRA